MLGPHAVSARAKYSARLIESALLVGLTRERLGLRAVLSGFAGHQGEHHDDDRDHG